MKSIKRNLKLRKLEEYAMDKLIKINNVLNKSENVKSNKSKVRNYKPIMFWLGSVWSILALVNLTKMTDFLSLLLVDTRTYLFF